MDRITVTAVAKKQIEGLLFDLVKYFPSKVPQAF
jgi:hypothetical protein